MQIGVDLGGSHIGVGLVTQEGKLMDSVHGDITDRTRIQSYIPETIISYIQELLQRNQMQEGEITKIGLAVPGSFKKGAILHAVNLGIEKLEIASILHSYFKVPVVGNNDVKCAGIAEKRIGSLTAYEDALFLTIGTGIGGAYFYQGELVSPKRNSGLEVGHMVIDKNGAECNCGKCGCFETYCSIKRLKIKVRQILQLPEETSGKQIVEELRQNKQRVEIENIIEEYTDYLAIGLSNLVTILEPEVISIGGSFVHYADLFIPQTIKKIQERHLLFQERENLSIILAKLGNDAGKIGAAML